MKRTGKINKSRIRTQRQCEEGRARDRERETNGKKEENNNNNSGEKREKYERRKPMNRNDVLV